MIRIRPGVCALLLALAAPALGHRRQTPDVLPLTTSGDSELPRVSAQGQKSLALALEAPGGRQIVTISPFRDPDLRTPQGQAGDNANPSITPNGKRVLWDVAGPDGRQLVLSDRGLVSQLTQDPTGSAANPSVDITGLHVAFESTADLAGTGNPGARQVFVLHPGAQITQASTGVGTSRNPVVSAKKRRLAFESTSDPPHRCRHGRLADLAGRRAPRRRGAADERGGRQPQPRAQRRRRPARVREHGRSRRPRRRHRGQPDLRL